MKKFRLQGKKDKQIEKKKSLTCSLLSLFFPFMVIPAIFLGVRPEFFRSEVSEDPFRKPYKAIQTKANR